MRQRVYVVIFCTMNKIRFFPNALLGKRFAEIYHLVSSNCCDHDIGITVYDNCLV